MCPFVGQQHAAKPPHHRSNQNTGGLQGSLSNHLYLKAVAHKLNGLQQVICSVGGGSGCLRIWPRSLILYLEILTELKGRLEQEASEGVVCVGLLTWTIGLSFTTPKSILVRHARKISGKICGCLKKKEEKENKEKKQKKEDKKKDQKKKKEEVKGLKAFLSV